MQAPVASVGVFARLSSHRPPLQASGRHAPRIKFLTKTALFAGLVFICTYFFKVPIPLGTAYFNLGDVSVYLSALFLPPVSAVIASGLGSGLADLLYGAVVYIPATIVIKGFMVWLFAKFGKVFGLLYAVIALVAGYFIYEFVLFGFAYATSAFLFNVLQDIASVVIFVILLQPLQLLKHK